MFKLQLLYILLFIYSTVTNIVFSLCCLPLANIENFVKRLIKIFQSRNLSTTQHAIETRLNRPYLIFDTKYVSLKT